ncbi:CYTH domain-containing protein [Marinobacter halophilus]|uniref:CYTH domain-containing protein n=1 Tax=Marinobacter halophilus TaxID=1323740 RepID=A0A2T1KG37_9GAMM|nr:CYTH domain-containing protein [Marinobacter halophilus]PSF09094.1 CYTH domain-containing protein [Marinobacter halophilus]GGC83459.1 hypothetical protein GCM10011362_34830 [Marinobacter halophilus]
MATELEIKLTLSPNAQTKAADWLLAQPEAQPGPRKTLINRYYDTADAALNRARAALRVRQAGDHYIQTLKTQGEFVEGAHRRQEWEWPLSGPELDLSLLDQTPLSDQLDPTQLQLAFETNFTRQVIMLHTADAVIEVAVDSGEIVGGGQVRPLHEVEFELKDGKPEALMVWARALAREIPVFLNLVSKAEQGYHLAGIHQPVLDEGDRELTVTEFLHRLSLAWLLQASVTFADVALVQVRQVAMQSGTQAIWSELQSALVNGATVPDLVQRVPRLGELQLVLASTKG